LLPPASTKSSSSKCPAAPPRSLISFPVSPGGPRCTSCARKRTGRGRPAASGFACRGGSREARRYCRGGKATRVTGAGKDRFQSVRGGPIGGRSPPLGRLLPLRFGFDRPAPFVHAAAALQTRPAAPE